MPGYLTIGDRYGSENWETLTFNGKDFEVLSPEQLFLDVIKYEELPNEWDLKTIALIGGQESGKSNSIRHIVDLILSNEDFKGLTSVVSTNDLRILGDERYAHYFKNDQGRPNPIIVLILDDAVRAGMDARRSMSGANVDITQQFLTTRHILEDQFRPNGIIFMLFAVQSLSRLDKTIRETAQLKIFTQYYDQDWFHREFTMEQAELLRIATYEGLVKSDYDARSAALVKTLTGDTATLWVPYIPDTQVQYPYVDRTIPKDEVVGRLTEALLTDWPEKLGIDPEQLDLGEFTKSTLKGYLTKHIVPDIEDRYDVNITRSDLVNAIEQALSDQTIEYYQQGKAPKKAGTIDKSSGDLTNVDKVLNALKIKGVADKETLMMMTDLSKKELDPILYDYTDKIKNVKKGFGIFALKDHNCTKEEVEQYLPQSYLKRQNRPVLEMPSS